MSRVRRRLFTFCSAVSLLVCVAVCVLWAAGGDRIVDVRHNDWPRADAGRMVFVQARSYGGTLRVEVERRRIGPPYTSGLSPGDAAELAQRFPAGTAWRSYVVRGASARASPASGFAAERAEFTPRTPGYQLETAVLAAPAWLPAVLFALLPALWLYRYRTGRRAARGLCPNCGYDVRATPGRCPECGHAAQVSVPPISAGPR